MNNILAFLFWPPSWWKYRDGALILWFGIWAVLIIGVILPGFAFFGLMPGVKGFF